MFMAAKPQGSTPCSTKYPPTPTPVLSAYSVLHLPAHVHQQVPRLPSSSLWGLQLLSLLSSPQSLEITDMCHHIQLLVSL